jgi:hypothetical protein
MATNNRKMDNTTFKELLDAGEIGLILADGDKALTKEQLRLVKEKAKQQSDQKLLEMKYAQAQQPGYKESKTIPAITKLLKSAGNAMSGQKPQQEQTTEPTQTVEDTPQPRRRPSVRKATQQAKSLLGIAGSKIKGLASKLLDKPVPEQVVEDKKTNEEYLGSIYTLLVQIEEDRKQQLDKQTNNKESEETEEERRHKEIVKALSVRRPTSKPQKKPRKSKKKKYKETAKPAEPTTAPTTPTASPAKPPSVATVSTAVKVAVGVAGATGVAGAIAARESGGNYDITYGDRVDKKTNTLVNSAGQTTPEKFLGKKLTEFTLEEIKQFQAKKNAEVPGTGAVGAYQFMPSTLFGQKGKDGKLRPGLVQQLNIPMTAKFTKELQDKLYEKLHAQDVATLKQMGVPLTPGYEYMAHYIGAGGAKLVYEESKKNTDKSVAQTLTDAGKSVGHNPELHKIKAKEFEGVLAKRLSTTGMIPHSSADNTPPVAQKTTGQSIDTQSRQNNDTKRDLVKQNATQQTTVNVTNVTSTSKQNDAPVVNDTPAPLRK